tara:strand:- start:184 stop:438 length:255 start_codon:yes stop_codon:yes gene_type:complete
MSDFVWLDVPLHKNKFKGIDFDELTTVQMSFDGAIMAVKRELVEPHYIENDVQMIKAGYKKMPKGLEVKTEDDLYKFLAYFVSL